MSLLGTAAAGMQSAESRFQQTASRVARAAEPGEGVDLGRAAAEQIDEKAALTANVHVARTADEMVGTLLDVIA